MDTSRRLTLPVVKSLPIYHNLFEPDLETDQQLIAQVQQQSQLALEKLYDRYAAQSNGIAFKILQDRALAEEVTLNAFWWLWKYPFLPQSSDDKFFGKWLFGIVGHLAKTELHRQVVSALPTLGQQLKESSESALISSTHGTGTVL